MVFKTATQNTDYKTLAQEVRLHTERLLQLWLPKAKEKVYGKTSYVCPLCQHGEHGDGLAINPHSKSNPKGVVCYGRCKFKGSIIELYQQAQGVNFVEAVHELADMAGIEVTAAALAQKKIEQAQRDFRKDNNMQEDDTTRTLRDYSRENVQFEEALYYLEDTSPAWEYLKKRGISKATADRAHLGYNAAKQRITFPTIFEYNSNGSKEGYEGRAIYDNPKYKVLCAKGAGKGIFNLWAINDTASEVFVTEGLFDAISVMEAGRDAVSICSTNNKGKFIDMLVYIRDHSRNKSLPLLLLCLDKDEAGQKTQAELAEELSRLNINHVEVDINGKYKDASEHLEKDKESFLKAIDTALSVKRPDSIRGYFAEQIYKDAATFRSEIKTGFADYDKFTGGLYSGLYVLGAISSLGKTTFCHQLADQLAEQGQEVLFFSLEQSRFEMASKSIAREIAKLHNDKLGQPELMTSRGLRRTGFKDADVQEVVNSYLAKTGERLSIIEGNFNCNINYISNYVRSYIDRTGTRPVVIVDYLQVIPPAEDSGKYTDAKQRTDLHMVELKRLSRELNLCIIAISSVNRSNYHTPINFESFKESGGIEYTADVVLGLQLSALSKNKALIAQDEQKDKGKRRQALDLAKRATPREVELVILKNRFGSIGGESDRLYFLYYPQHDYFIKDVGAEFGASENNNLVF